MADVVWQSSRKSDEIVIMQSAAYQRLKFNGQHNFAFMPNSAP